jgi:uncharacterized protein YgiM (DUF1202 family)
MIDERTNKRLCNGVLWCLAACLLVVILTSCSPLAMYQAPATATPTAATTATEPAAVTATKEPTPRPSCTVTAGALNFREGPGMSYAVTEILTKGDVLEVITRGVWLKVHLPRTTGAGSTGKATGFIYSAYCR